MNRGRVRGWVVLFSFFAISVACTSMPPVAKQVGIEVKGQAFSVPATTCADMFVQHLLDHVTTVEGEVVRLFESNGAGLAINDLDNDGDLDLVLANLAGPNAIFWNEGAFQFRKEPLSHGDSRAVAIVDVDGDGWQDLVFTRRTTRPTYWHNDLGIRSTVADPAFTETFLPGVAKPAYAMAWGDLDQDGDLDLVTGSYDLALQMTLGDKFRFGEGAGLHYYEQQAGTFVRHFLARHAQTLALLLADVNGDGRLDIVAGNDFDLPDQIWLNRTDGWQEATPFAATTQNTMSFDLGDINNDGAPELYATDMMPYAHDAATMAAWQPVMDRMPHEMKAGDPQVMENVLQVRQPDGRYQNLSQVAGVDATGWSWSAKFGDLDNDGFLDLYIVNGMAALDLFEHLPNHELVEENQAFRNNAGSLFTAAPEWRLNSTAGGRGMSMADLDNDGDLDIVVNNLLQSATIFENRLCGGAGLTIDLWWPSSRNTRAIGARLILQTAIGNFYRDVRTGSGYLSGDPARVHFGVPADAAIQKLEIQWPDGRVDSIAAPVVGKLVQITRH